MIIFNHPTVHLSNRFNQISNTSLSYEATVAFLQVYLIGNCSVSGTILGQNVQQTGTVKISVMDAVLNFAVPMNLIVRDGVHGLYRSEN